MKLCELRPPRAALMHSALSVKNCLKPRPHPALSVTVESPTRTILIFGLFDAGVWAGDWMVRHTSNSPVITHAPRLKSYFIAILQFLSVIGKSSDKRHSRRSGQWENTSGLPAPTRPRRLG